MKKISKLIITLFFLFILLSKEEVLMGQIPVGRTGPYFINPLLTTDCCPKIKATLDSIINNAPYIFEGKMVRGGAQYGDLNNGKPYKSYLFEIEKVYRSENVLKSGTVEYIARMPVNSIDPLPVGYPQDRWIVLFAKEADVPGAFDANNAIKIELFYNNEMYRPSYFQENIKDISYYSGLSLEFRTKEELRAFLATYDLYPTDMPKADTVKKFTRKESENARKDKKQ